MNRKRFKVSLLTLVMMFVLVFAMGITTMAAAAAPSNLKQTAGSTTYVTVSWDSVVGAYGYNVYYSEDNKSFVRTSNASIDTFSTTKMITGLSAGRTYYVKVVAVTRDTSSYPTKYIEGTHSASIDVVTAPDVSSAEAIQTKATTSSFTIKVNGASGANYFKVIDYDDVVYGTSTKSSIVCKKLKPGVKENLKVLAARKSSKGFIAGSSYKYVTCKTLADKLKKSEYGITNAYTNINSYYFAVNTTDNIDGTQLQFANVKDKKIKTYTEKSKSFNVRNFVNGRYYKYRMRTYIVVNGKKVYSAWSDYKSIAVPKKVSTKAKRLSGNNRQITIDWSAVKDATDYTVYISTKENTGFKKLGKVSAKKRSITIKKIGKKNLKSGVTYYIRLVSNYKNKPVQSYVTYSFKTY